MSDVPGVSEAGADQNAVGLRRRPFGRRVVVAYQHDRHGGVGRTGHDFGGLGDLDRLEQGIVRGLDVGIEKAEVLT